MKISKRELNEKAIRLLEVKAEIAALEAEAEAARQAQERQDRVIVALEEDRSRRQQSLREILGEIEGLHQSYTRDADRMHRLELSRARTDGDLKTLQERIWNTYELTYATAEPFRREGSFSLSEADKRVAELNSAIRALGVVNVKAVEEYAETKARFDELTAQRQDLEKAEADLKDLIARLLERMKGGVTAKKEKR